MSLPRPRTRLRRHMAAPAPLTADRPDALLLARRDATVATDVAALRAHDDVHGLLVPGVAHEAHRRRVDAGKPAGAEHVPRTVAELHLHASRVDEVQLLLLVVEVRPGLDPGRQDDRVHAERLDGELLADLAEARALPEVRKARHRVAVTRRHLRHVMDGTRRGTLRRVRP